MTITELFRAIDRKTTHLNAVKYDRTPVYDRYEFVMKLLFGSATRPDDSPITDEIESSAVHLVEETFERLLRSMNDSKATREWAKAFDEGKHRFQCGDYVGARDKFERARRIAVSARLDNLISIVTDWEMLTSDVLDA